MRLYVLDTGLIQSSDMSMWSPNAAAGSYGELSVRSYVIVHPRGTILWDTGIDDDIAAAADGKRSAPTIVFRVPRTLRSRLDEIGITPGDIDHVGLSHLHVDHVGNSDLFPRSTVLLQHAEREAGFGPDPQRFTLDPAAYAELDQQRIETCTATTTYSATDA
jgi:N-acyl homoserine lactone hydrolase